MAIENRKLENGTVLEARYRGRTYTCDVVTYDGKRGYRVTTGMGTHTFTSPSRAGKEVRDGKETNGWAFWSVAGAAKVSPENRERGTRVMAEILGAAKALKSRRVAVAKSEKATPIRPRKPRPVFRCDEHQFVFDAQAELDEHIAADHAAVSA